MKKTNMRNKKGMALETLALLILALISFAVGLIILLRSGLFSTAQSFACPALTTFGSASRGVVIQSLWAFFWILIAVVSIIQAALVSATGTASIMVSPVLGVAATAVNASIAAVAFGAFVIFLHAQFMDIQSGIPLASCESPEINLQYHEDCTAAGTQNSKGVSKVTFLTEVAKRSADCWNMYSQGKYDPLLGLHSPNPKTCFIIDFNIDEPVTFNEMAWFLNNLKFDQKQTYLTKISGGVILENHKTGSAFDKTIKKGVLFIKYGDHASAEDQFLNEGESYFNDQDCDITFKYNPPTHKSVVDEFSKMNLCNPKDEEPYNTMNGLTDQTECLTSVAKARSGVVNYDSNDFVYWCLKEEATQDGLCNAFSWS